MVTKKKRVVSRGALRGRSSRASRSVAPATARRRLSLRGRKPRPQGRLSQTRKRLKKKGSKSLARIEVNAPLAAAVREFEAAVLLFRKENFSRAKEIFEKLSVSGPPEVGSRASSYLTVCEQKLAAISPIGRSARDYYDMGIAQLNARELDNALENLTRADKATPNREHIHYALAAVCALKGNAETALGHLAKAIELRPANRSMAAQDQDFQQLSSDSRFQRLIRLGVS